MTDIPEAYLAKAEAALHGMAFYSRPEYSSALVRVASALMEAEARGEARGMERAAKMAGEFCEKNEEYLRNAPSLRFQSGPSTDVEKRRREAMAKHAWAYRNIATAIRDRGGQNE